MRALHLVKTVTGASWALRQVARLVEAGVEVHVLLPDASGLTPRYQAAGAETHVVVPAGEPATFRAAAAVLRRGIDHIRPDVVHSHFLQTTLLMRAVLGRRSDIPRLFQVPGPLHLEFRPSRWLDVATSSGADHWVASSEYVRACYERLGTPASRLHLAYYGFDLDEVRLGPAGKLRAELGVHNRRPLVGMVAYMYRPKRYLGMRQGIKGHEDLFAAMAARGRHDALVVVVGGPWTNAERYAEALVAQGHQRLGDRIRFLGTRTDVMEIYADIDVAVVPSHSENLGGAAEPLLLGKPTVATSVGGLPELVVPGETGWLVPPRSPGALREAIDEALDDPVDARARGQRGQAHARALLDDRRSAAMVLDVYEQVMR